MLDKKIWFEMLKKTLKHNPMKKYRIKIIGKSMFPTYKEGDYVEVDYINIKDIKIGDIIVHNHWKDNMTIHRVVDIIEKDIKYIKTRGDNNSVDDEYLVIEEDIIGKVIPKC